MATITFSNGVKVNFNGTPTQKDIDEIAAKVAGSTTKAPAAPAPQKKKTLAENVGDFLGIGDFGRGLGQAAAQGSGDVKNAQKSQDNLRQVTNQLLQHALELPPASDRRKQLLKLVQQNEQMLGDLAQESVKDLPTNRQFLTSAANTAINIAGAGTLGAKAGGAGVLGTTKYAAMPLKGIVAQSTAEAGLLSASKSYGEGKTAKESFVSALGPAAIAGGLTLGTGLLARAITKKLEQTPINAMRRTVHQGLEDTKKEVMRRASSEVTGDAIDEGKDFAETLLQDNVKGGRKNLLKQALTQVDDLGKKIKKSIAAPAEVGVTDEAGKILEGPEYKLATKSGMDAFDRAARKSEARVAPLINTEKYRDFFDQLLQKQGAAIDEADQELLHKAAVGNLNIEDGYELRKLLDSITPKSGFAADPSTAVSSRALTRASGDLRRQIASWSAKYDPSLQPLINKQSVYIRLRDTMAEEIAKIIHRSPNISIQGLMNAISSTISSPAVGTRVAQGVKGLNMALSKTGGLRNLTRSAIISGSINAQK